MKEKKNIDRLFQEKFKDFEVHPSDKVWENIVSAKAKKEDRKIIPIWWRLGGIAALLVLLVSIGLSLWNSTENTDTPQIVTSEKTTNENDQNSDIDTSLPSSSDTNEELVSNGNLDAVTENSSENTLPNTNVTNSLNNNSNSIVTRDNNPNSSTLNTVTAITNQNGTVIKNTNSPSDNTQSPSSNKLFTQDKKDENNAIAVVSDSQKRSDLIIDSNTPIPSEDTENPIVAVEEETTTSEEDLKKSLVEEAARIASANNEEEDLEKDAIIKRWDVGAIAAPVYSGDFGGSGIDPQFKDNSKSSDVNVSYGVQVSYAVNSKFKIRTGVSNVDLTYNTQDVSFSPDINPRSLEGLNPNENTRFLSITDRVTDRNNNAQELSDGAGAGSRSVSDGEIQQNVGYIEIPVEAVYVISDKRLGVEFIGGISTLLLNNNEVFLESEGLRTDLGSANSLNDVSFTTNIGLGLNYKMTEKLKLNMEPSLKYQLNAYDSSAGDFKPYFIGLYTGVTYRF